MTKIQLVTNTIINQGALPLYYNADETVTLEILRSLYKAGIRAVEYTSRGEAALSNFTKMVEVRNAEMPEMLSYKVEQRYNLITYAKSLYNINKNRTSEEDNKFHSMAIKLAAAKFYSRLKELETTFKVVSAMQTEGTEEYNVLQPELTAVSILI